MSEWRESLPLRMRLILDALPPLSEDVLAWLDSLPSTPTPERRMSESELVELQREAFREGARAVLDLMADTPWIVRAYKAEWQAKWLATNPATTMFDLNYDTRFTWGFLNTAAVDRYPLTSASSTPTPPTPAPPSRPLDQ